MPGIQTEADIGFDIMLEISDGAAIPVWTEVPFLTGLDLPQPTFEEFDTTHYKSPNRTRENKPGLKEPGEASFANDWIEGSAMDAILQGLFASGAVVDIRVTFPGASVLTFKAWVKGYLPSVPLGEKMTAQTTLRVTGSVTYT